MKNPDTTKPGTDPFPTRFRFFFDLFTKNTAEAQAALYRGNLPKRAKPATQSKNKKPP
jgi:hypothetical protein